MDPHELEKQITGEYRFFSTEKRSKARLRYYCDNLALKSAATMKYLVKSATMI